MDGHNGQLQIKASGTTFIEPDEAESPSGSDTLLAQQQQYPRSKSAVLLQALNPTLTLENSGSVARDHLASERTWLAYVRTSLAIAGSGVALVQLFTLSTWPHNAPGGGSSGDGRDGNTALWFVRPLGATTILLALGVLAIGVLRYFKIQNAMTQGQFPVARQTVVLITALLAALVAVTFGILVMLPWRT